MKKKLTLLCLFCTKIIFGQVIEHLEPSTWWIGMKNPLVQVMVHGNNISSLKPSTHHAGFKIIKIHKTDNKNYLFLDLLIAKDQLAGKRKISFSRNNIEICHFDFELKTRNNGSRQRVGFNNSNVIYLITPDRFVNGNIKNDSITTMIEKPDYLNIDGRHGGDIAGISSKLNYIHDMGFTAIWSMPLLTNNNPSYSYHGYGITDFYEIDPRFGTNQSFKDLNTEAKKSDLKIIQDVVLNHCGIGHWWLNDPPASDWINKAGIYTQHNRESHQDPNRSKADLTELENGWFVPTMPDLNQRNPFLATYLIQNTLWWIEYAGLSGIRIDTYPYSNKAFLSKWSEAILNEFPYLSMVGEEWSLSPTTISYWQKNKVNQDLYKSYVPSMMDFPLQQAIISSLLDSTKNAFSQMYQTLAQDYIYADPSKLVTFLDNHDMSRYLTQVHYNKELYKMGLVALLTTRGIPQIYYGTEIGMTNPSSDAHGEIRGNFINLSLSDSNATNLQDFCKKLLLLRQKERLLQDGKLMHFYPINGLYVYFRYDKNEQIMVILNKSKKAIEVDMERFKELVSKNATWLDLIDNTNLSGKITVQAEAFRILKTL